VGGGFRWLPADLSGLGLFYSDLHFGRTPAADDQLLAEFDKLLTVRPLPDFVICGGDTFDFLVGPNRVAIARISAFLSRLRRLLEAGVRVWMLEGNHDFHLAWLAGHLPGLQIAADGIEDRSQRLRLTHGDGLTPGAWYTLLRRGFRLPTARALLATLPDNLVDGIARRWSQTSYDLRGQQPGSLYLEQVAAAFAQRMEAEPGWNWISGHIHYPATIERTFGTWWINGYWPRHFSHVVIRDGRVEGLSQSGARGQPVEVGRL